MKIILDLDSYWDALIEGDVSYFNNKNAQKNWLYYFIKKANNAAFEVLLAEEYLKKREFSFRDVIISERRTINTSALLATQATPLIIYTCEPSNVDWKFYWNIYKYTRCYKHAFLFSGSEKHISKHVKFHRLYWPNDTRKMIETGHYISKRKLVMVSGNHKVHYALSLASRKISKLIRITIRKISAKCIARMKFTNLFPLRMKALVYFSSKNYFDLYGRGWNNDKYLTNEERNAVKKLNPKPINDKDSVVSQYQFALCFENTIYPGYVIEKIFDCFISGCIPIYYGAPNIDEYVPANTFIDMRRFKNFDELALCIENMPQQKIDEYLYNIKKYLNIDMFFKYTAQYLANELFLTVKEFKKKCSFL